MLASKKYQDLRLIFVLSPLYIYNAASENTIGGTVVLIHCKIMVWYLQRGRWDLLV